jgi:tetratricopeptide (TPR) repeat protein
MDNKTVFSDNELLARAQKQQHDGDLKAAVSIFRDLVTRHGKNSRLLHSAGSAELQAGNSLEAITLLKRSLGLDPKQPDTFSHLGVAYWNLRDYEQAATAYRAAIALKPVYAEPYNNLCMVLLEGFNQPHEALHAVDRAITLKPDYADAFVNRGNVLQALERFDEALESYDRAIALKPNSEKSWNNRGNVLRHLNRLIDALSCYQKAIEINPNYAEAFCNMGLVLASLDHLEDARHLYQKSIALNPSFANVYFNLAALEGQNVNRELVLEHLNRAIELKPDFANAYWNKALFKLLLGDYKEGFALYEWGWKCKLRGGDRGFKQPRWLGETPLAGKRLLIHQEQGLGDCIQYARYIQLASDMGATVILETLAPLIPLLKTLLAPCEIVTVGERLPNFDCYIPLMSLPLAFRTTLDNMPPATPYLFTDMERSQVWEAKLGPKHKPRIGIVWSGSTLHKNDHNRSMSLKDLLPLFSLPLEFHCLQKEIREHDRQCLPALPMIHVHDTSLHDFADTAALASLMDVVISVDTSVAHVAGALGQRVWLMLATNPDWRWMLDRDDSPWYPSARLFRQDKTGNWNEAVCQIRGKLIDTFLERSVAS